MPVKIIHTLQVVGDDNDGSLSTKAILFGLNKIPFLESISLNLKVFVPTNLYQFMS